MYVTECALLCHSVASQIDGPHDLQGARGPHSPQREFFAIAFLSSDNPHKVRRSLKHRCLVTSHVCVGSPFLCNLFHRAQRTHEAAREGNVPLCGDNIWNPQHPPWSPHSGLMRQPTKEGPACDVLGGPVQMLCDMNRSSEQLALAL